MARYHEEVFGIAGEFRQPIVIFTTTPSVEPQYRSSGLCSSIVPFSPITLAHLALSTGRGGDLCYNMLDDSYSQKVAFYG
jgi:hypothetical protein